jgi:hypothetical protein
MRGRHPSCIHDYCCEYNKKSAGAHSDYKNDVRRLVLIRFRGGHRTEHGCADDSQLDTIH